MLSKVTTVRNEKDGNSVEKLKTLRQKNLLEQQNIFHLIFFFNLTKKFQIYFDKMVEG